MKDHLTTRELAKLLGKHEETLGLWRKRNIGPPYVRKGELGWCYYPKKELGKWLMDQEI